VEAAVLRPTSPTDPGRGSIDPATSSAIALAAASKQEDEIMPSYRRVVTGLNAAGQSCVIFDGPGGIASESGARTILLWKTDSAPASNAGIADAADEPSSFDFPRGGSKFVIVHFPPGTGEHSGRGMHASNTLDYGVVLSGRVTIVLEEGEADLGPGDLIIDRGVSHAWRNSGSEDCAVLWTILDAEPVGAGATV
jgi:mannose-6-phosphate isomerase-like protein (cupin superfamily)